MDYFGVVRHSSTIVNVSGIATSNGSTVGKHCAVLRDDWRESPFLVCQNHQRGKCRRFLIFGPGRSERTTKGGDLLPHPSRRFAERCLDNLVEVTLSKPGHRKVQTLACFRKGLAKEFAFCRMNQGV